MRAQIHPQQHYIAIDGEPLTIKDVPWPGPALEGFCTDEARPIEVIMFDGAIGTIQRRSRAPGRIDVEHFVGAEPLQPYAAMHAAESKRLADEKQKKNQEEEARAQHAAQLAALAEKGM